jgi:hypothetical protein
MVKSLGAGWNPIAKKWCVPAGVDLTAFKKWLPKTENDCDQWALAPIYLVESIAGCWQCGRSAPVITLLSEGVEFKSGEKSLTKICVFDYIRFIPLMLEKFLAKRFTNHDLIYHHARRKPLSTLINLGSRASKSSK